MWRDRTDLSDRTERTGVPARWTLPALVWIPFLSLFVFAAAFWGGDTYSHVLFHVVALALLLVALTRLRALRTVGGRRLGRAAAVVLSVSVPLAIVGHAVELAAAVVRLVDEGWANVDTDDLFERGVHAWAANVTVPMMMTSMLVSVALAVVGPPRSDAAG